MYSNLFYSARKAEGTDGLYTIVPLRRPSSEMAARRVASSAVQWAQIAERVPVKQREAFRALKGRNDAYISKLVYECLLPFAFNIYWDNQFSPT